jgi:hypothetical protein
VAEIYGLYSGRDGKVRYVGQTLGTHDVRFKEHQRVGSDHVIRPVYQWIHREWNAGFPVWSVLLEECDNAARHELEGQWIGKFPNLLNERKRGYYWRECKPPIIPEVRRNMSRFIFNCDGYHGIHYWRDLDRYSVFVYIGRDGWRWLPGDGAPGWTGEIWFSDRTQALKARDKDRQGRNRNWLPDREQELDLPDIGLQLPDTCGPLEIAPSINAAECNTAFKSEFAGTIT